LGNNYFKEPVSKIIPTQAVNSHPALIKLYLLIATIKITSLHEYYLTSIGENETVELRGLNFMECSGQKLHVVVGNEMDWCGGK